MAGSRSCPTVVSTAAPKTVASTMAQVTAMGCAAGALIAAALACAGDALTAAAAGLGALGIAGEIAGETARGPGSFAVGILDALAGLDAETLARRARLDLAAAREASS